MQSSNFDYQTWAMGIYLCLTSLKGVSSMKLHRGMNITQKSAWHLAHRLRKAMEHCDSSFTEPVEVDETYVGGLRPNMSEAKWKELAPMGRVPSGKAAVVGVKDRDSNEVHAEVVQSTDADTLQSFVVDHTNPRATVYTDEALAYKGLPFDHHVVRHSIHQYVKGDAHTNGIESLWSMLKRGRHKGTFHKFSLKHLDRYVQEFAGRHNMRQDDTITQMEGMMSGLEGKQLQNQDLIAYNGLDSGART